MGKELLKVNSDRQRQRFSKAFKLNAIQLLQAGQKPATQLALELGIRRNLLYKWAETLNKTFRGQVLQNDISTFCFYRTRLEIKPYCQIESELLQLMGYLLTMNAYG